LKRELVIFCAGAAVFSAGWLCGAHVHIASAEARPISAAALGANWPSVLLPVDKDWGIQMALYTGPGVPVPLRWVPLPNTTNPPKTSAAQMPPVDPKTLPIPPKETGK
jgi:hypothetical protein